MATKSNVSNSPPPTPSKNIGWHDWIFFVCGILLLLIGCILLGVRIQMIKDGDYKDMWWYILFNIFVFVIGLVCLWGSKISNPGLIKNIADNNE